MLTNSLSDFLAEWVPYIVDSQLPSQTGAPVGGSQQNPKIVERVKALKAAYDKFLIDNPAAPIDNPAPNGWAKLNPTFS